MPNTNFQTIHQMGQAINEVVRQATGRDVVQNIDMDHVTVAQNSYYEEVTASGSMVSFTDRVGGLPLEKCVVKIVPVQEGEGDPSPDNVRPINGWTGVNIYVSPTTDSQDGTIDYIPFPSSVGTVYGGVLDVKSGVLTVTHRLWSTNNRPATDPTGIGTEGDITYFWLYTGPSNRTYFNDIKCDKLKNYQSVGYISTGFRTVSVYQASINIFMPSTLVGTTKNSISAYLDAHPINFWVQLVTPITYQLTPQEIRTLLGQNNIWADTGDIEVKYKVLKEMY